MAGHPQAQKRNRQRVKRQAHHRHYRTSMRTHVKRVRAAIAEKDHSRAREALGTAVPFIDRCAGKGLLPAKRAARTVSRLTTAVNDLSQ